MLTLNHKVYGQGPALIILHGLFGSLDNWATHARVLSEQFSVYLLDQRNHGKSPHSDEWNYAVMAEDLHEFMDEQGIMQAHLLGHSMGGKTVMTFAGHYPERIDKLIVADMGIRTYRPHHTAIIEALCSLDLNTISSRQEATSRLSEKIQPPSVVQFLVKSLGRNAQKKLSWKFNLEVIAKDYDLVLEGVNNDFPYDGPTLFLSGAESSYVKQEDHDSIREQFPQAIFEEIEGAGHWLHADRPAEFIQKLRRFLEG